MYYKRNINIMKKLVTILSVVAVILLAGAAVYYFMNRSYQSNKGTFSVSLGEKFRMGKGETAQLDNLDVYLKITDFINSPCPSDSVCIWSGLAVVYELSVDGKKYEASTGSLGKESPYQVSVEDSDYESYADFIITKR